MPLRLLISPQAAMSNMGQSPILHFRLNVMQNLQRNSKPDISTCAHVGHLQPSPSNKFRLCLLDTMNNNFHLGQEIYAG